MRWRVSSATKRGCIIIRDRSGAEKALESQSTVQARHDETWSRKFRLRTNIYCLTHRECGDRTPTGEAIGLSLAVREVPVGGTSYALSGGLFIL